MMVAGLLTAAIVIPLIVGAYFLIGSEKSW